MEITETKCSSSKKISILLFLSLQSLNEKGYGVVRKDVFKLILTDYISKYSSEYLGEKLNHEQIKGEISKIIGILDLFLNNHSSSVFYNDSIDKVVYELTNEKTPNIDKMVSMVVREYLTYTQTQSINLPKNILLYSEEPNQKYRIDTNEPQNIFDRLNDKEKERRGILTPIINWELITDGSVTIGKMPHEYSNFNLQQQLKLSEIGLYIPRLSRIIDVTNSKFVLVRGFKDEQRIITFIHTLMYGESLRRIIEISGDENLGNLVTNQKPNVRVLRGL